MFSLSKVVDEIRIRSADSRRYLIALAGPPGAGKTTFAAKLRLELQPDTAVIVPMDGFHYDNVILDKRGLRRSKGSPETFDYNGFESLLQRLCKVDSEIAFPTFDRGEDLSRAAAGIVSPDAKFIILEGNYLLLYERPWSRAVHYFDFTIFVSASQKELKKRLVQRWIEYGFSLELAQERVYVNDMVNADRVLSTRMNADLHADTTRGEARFSWGRQASLPRRFDKHDVL